MRLKAAGRPGVRTTVLNFSSIISIRVLNYFIIIRISITLLQLALHYYIIRSIITTATTADSKISCYDSMMKLVTTTGGLLLIRFSDAVPANGFLSSIGDFVFVVLQSILLKKSYFCY